MPVQDQWIAAALRFFAARRRAVMEIAILGLVFSVIFALLIVHQGFEAFYEFTRRYEDIQLDNLALALVPGCLVLAIFAGLRFRDSHRAQRSLQGLIEQRDMALERENALRTAAEDASRAKSAFLANMSHELRTPLNAIIGYTEIAVEDLALGVANAETALDLGKVVAASKHLLSLINDVLDLSKVEAGQALCDVTTFDVDELVDEVGAIASPLAAKSGAQLTWRDLHFGAITSDRRMLKQCLLNLVSNACKFAPGGSVRIVAERGDKTLHFRVIDSGIGMSVEQMERVFEPFHQADATITKRFGGTGLGLSIVRRLAEKLGGDVWFESALGEGTTAHFTVQTDWAAWDAKEHSAIAA